MKLKVVKKWIKGADEHVCLCVCSQLLATVLSQSAKAKEHLLEQSKSVDQPPGTRTAQMNSDVFVFLYYDMNYGNTHWKTGDNKEGRGQGYIFITKIKQDEI